MDKPMDCSFWVRVERAQRFLLRLLDLSELQLRLQRRAVYMLAVLCLCVYVLAPTSVGAKPSQSLWTSEMFSQVLKLSQTHIAEICIALNYFASISTHSISTLTLRRSAATSEEKEGMIAAANNLVVLY